MPDLIRHPEVVEFAGFRLEFIPHSVRGRNDFFYRFSAFYETIILLGQLEIQNAKFFFLPTQQKEKYLFSLRPLRLCGELYND